MKFAATATVGLLANITQVSKPTGSITFQIRTLIGYITLQQSLLAPHTIPKNLLLVLPRYGTQEGQNDLQSILSTCYLLFHKALGW